MQKLLTFFSAKILALYAKFSDQSFNDTLTKDIVSFEQQDSDILYRYQIFGDLVQPGW